MIVTVRKGAIAQYINMTVKPLLLHRHPDKNKFEDWVQDETQDRQVGFMLKETIEEAKRIIGKFWNKVSETKPNLIWHDQWVFIKAFQDTFNTNTWRLLRMDSTRFGLASKPSWTCSMRWTAPRWTCCSLSLAALCRPMSWHIAQSCHRGGGGGLVERGHGQLYQLLEWGPHLAGHVSDLWQQDLPGGP